MISLGTRERILLGKYLADNRRLQGVPQRELAEDIGLTSSQYISNVERGLCAPSVELLHAYVDVCNVPRRTLVKLLKELYGDTISEVMKGGAQ